MHWSVRYLMRLVLVLMKSWWLTTRKRNHISGVTWDTVRITLNQFCIISFSCTFAFDSSVSIHLKLTSFDLLLPTMSLTFLDLKLYFCCRFWPLLCNFPLTSHWSVLPKPFPTSILLLSGVASQPPSHHQSFDLLVEVGWNCLSLELILLCEYRAILQFFFSWW